MCNHERNPKRSGIRMSNSSKAAFSVCIHCRSLYDTGELPDMIIEETTDDKLKKAHELLAILESRGGLGHQVHNAIQEILGMSGHDWLTLQRLNKL